MTLSSFSHGVHPHGHKEATEVLAVERMPFVARYSLPLAQHGGKPSVPIVMVGAHVLRGEVIAEADGFVSATLHAPVSGRVSAIAPQLHPRGSFETAIEIEADPYATQQLPPPAATDWRDLALEEFISAVQRAGIVGMGGAAFPSHVKYRLPDGKQCRRLVINGCECEPYLTCDHRLMVERAEDVVLGAEIVATKLGAESIWFGVEVNKPDAIVALETAAARLPHAHVAPLRVKYPQGAEKMLIKALFDEEVPPGQLPLDLEIVVNNVASMAAIADWFERGIPLIERWVTVSGPGVDRPSNLVVPIGTPVRDIMRHCGINHATREVIMGGPMMGTPLATLDVPALKGTSGLLAFVEEREDLATEYACLKCGRCLEACGNLLNPARLARLARANRLDELERSFVMDCMECGACTWACPSAVPIVHLIRTAKTQVRSRKRGPE